MSHRYNQQNLLCTISPSVPNVSYFHGTEPTSNTSTPEKRVKLAEFSNTEDSESSPSPDDSDPSSTAGESSKLTSIVGGVVSQTMAVTSILKTTTRSNEDTKIDIGDRECENDFMIGQTTEIQCTTVVETTTVITSAIDTTAIDSSNTYTTSTPNGCNSTTPMTVDTISCTCCTLVGSSEVCSKNENLQTDRLEFSIF